MATPHLQDLYQSGTAERETYLLKAESLANVTLPELQPRGNRGQFQAKFSQSPAGRETTTLTQPYTAAGTLAITGLAAGMQSLLLPINVNWFELALPATIAQTLDDRSRQQAEAKLDDLADAMRGLMDEHQLVSHMNGLLLRILVEPCALIQVTEDRLRVIPMRHFVVRWFEGRPAYAVFREEVPGSKSLEDTETLYTLVDFRENGGQGQVYQQRANQKQRKRIGRDKLDPRQFVVVTTQIPVSGDNYSYSLGMRHYGSIFALNQLSKNLLEGANQAAQNYVFVDPSSRISPADLARAKSGQIFSGNPQGIQWFSSGQKVNDWSFVAQYMELEKQDLAKAFALGILQQPDALRGEKTATEIERLGSELDASVGAHAQTLTSTLLRPLAEAYLVITARRNPALVEQVQPVVTAGSSAIARQISLNQLWQWTSLFLADPDFRQRYNLVDLYEYGLDALNLPNFTRSADEVQAEQQQQLQATQVRDQQLAVLRQQQIADNAGPIA